MARDGAVAGDGAVVLAGADAGVAVGVLAGASAGVLSGPGLPTGTAPGGATTILQMLTFTRTRSVRDASMNGPESLLCQRHRSEI